MQIIHGFKYDGKPIPLATWFNGNCHMFRFTYEGRHYLAASKEAVFAKAVTIEIDMGVNLISQLKLIEELATT